MDNRSEPTRPVIGVSPAFFISRFGDSFTADQVAEAAEEIAAIGCQACQLEIFHGHSIVHWLTQGARHVGKRLKDAGLGVTQFVAHFMLDAFADVEQLFSDLAYEQINQVLEIVERIDGCRIITIPIGPFRAPTANVGGNYHWMMDRCIVKIERLLHQVESSDRRLALELMPGSLIGGSDGFLRLCERLASPTLGFNLDTGHAWAAKENIYLIPDKLGPRILGTHLCDNFGNENVSLRPGGGSIDWPKMVANLTSSGYAGAYDLEVICAPRAVHQEYALGYHKINSILEQGLPTSAPPLRVKEEDSC